MSHHYREVCPQYAARYTSERALMRLWRIHLRRHIRRGIRPEHIYVTLRTVDGSYWLAKMYAPRHFDPPYIPSWTSINGVPNWVGVWTS